MRFILSILLLCFSVRAATYYVRTDGNDANTGSANDAANAWLTIQHAADTIGAGDTASVQAGTYNESVTINSGDGSAGNYKQFLASGSVTLTNFIVKDEYCYISGFTCLSGSVNDNGFYFDAGSDHTVVTNCIIEHQQIGMLCNLDVGQIPDDLLITRCTITNCQKGIYLVGVAGGAGHRLWSNTVVRLRQWVYANDMDYLRLAAGGNHQVVGNLCYGTLSNEVDTSLSTYPHIDNLQVWDYSAGHGPVTNLLVAWNFFLDAINGCTFSDVFGLGVGNNTFTNNIIGRGFPLVYSGQLSGQSPFNMETCAGTTIVKNNTWFGYGGRAVFKDFNTVVVQNNICLHSAGGYNLTGTTPGTGDYNCTYITWSPKKGPNDMTNNPSLVNTNSPLGADGIPWTADDGFRLQYGSPCIGAGTNGIDMGAYGGWFAPPMQNRTVRASHLRVGIIRGP